MERPELGVGLVYSAVLHELIEANPDLVHVVEVEPQTCWHADASEAGYRCDLTWLEHVRGLRQPKIVHGVGFPVGGSVSPEPGAVSLFSECVRRLDARWASEHLSFNRVVRASAGYNTGFFLPPLQSSAGVAAAARCIRRYQSALSVPFCIETGVNYLEPNLRDHADGAFVAAVVESADCGILLDLHNLWTNERNGRDSVERFLTEIPLDKVWEVHVAGGFEYSGFWLDAHSGEIPGPLLELTARVLPALPNLRAVVYEILPSFVDSLGLDGVLEQLRELDRLWQTRVRGRSSVLVTRLAGSGPDGTAVRDVEPSQWEAALGSLVVGRQADTPLATALERDPGVGVLRKLVWQFRAGAIVDTLPLTCRLIMLHAGEAGLRSWFDAFFAHSGPELFGSAEGDAFGDYLARQDTGAPYLSQLLNFEQASIRSVLERRDQMVTFDVEPWGLLEALRLGRIPARLEAGRFEVRVTTDSTADPNAFGRLS